ncbi:MAG: hypothetical protein ACOY0T_10180 [Myxococcota bacterium]
MLRRTVLRSRVLGYVLGASAAATLGCSAASDVEGAAERATAQAVTPPAGLLERTFVTDGTVRAVVQANGTIYVGGKFSYVGQRSGGFVALSASDGRRDKAWPELGGGMVDAIVSDGQGGFYVGGDFRLAGSVSVRGLAHVRSDGSVDPAFTIPVNGRVYSLALAGNTLYIGGRFTRIGAITRNLLGAVDVTTGAVTAFDGAIQNPQPTTGFAPTVRSVSVADGIVYAAGSFGASNEGVQALDGVTGARLWSGGVRGNFVATAIWGSMLFVGGDTYSGALFALDRTTGVRLSWDAGIAPRATKPGAEVHALSIAGQTLYVGGEFGFAGGVARGGAAAYDLNTLTVTPFDPKVAQLTNSNQIPTFVEAISVSGNTAYLAGSFESVNKTTRRLVAAVDAQTGNRLPWHITAPRRTACVAGISPDNLCTQMAFAVYATADTVFLGGDFTSVGGSERFNVAALDATTRRATSFAPRIDGTVNALDFVGGQLYVGGQFSAPMNGGVVYSLAQVDPASAQVVAGFGAQSGVVNAITHDASKLYVGGTFTEFLSSPRQGLASIDLPTGALSAWAPTADGVSALAVGNGAVYIAGPFDHVNGQPKAALAAVDAASGATLPFAPPVSLAPNDGSWSLALDGSVLYATGDFSVASPARSGLAAFDANTGAVGSWAPQLTAAAGVVPKVRALALAGHTVYMGGVFTQVNGQARSQLAAVDATGALTPFIAQVDSADGRAVGEVWSGFFFAPFQRNDQQIRGIYALSMLGDRLAIGGNFFSINSQDQSGFARFAVPAP